MITYEITKFENGLTFRSPVLHKIQFPKTSNYIEMRVWLETNCKHPFYEAPSWREPRFVEFEDDEDAMLFALRWS